MQSVGNGIEAQEDTSTQDPVVNFHFSPEFGKLVEALSKAVITFKTVTKDSTNPFFKSKYTDLSALVDATREPLAKQGLVVAQFLREPEDGKVPVTTFLLHTSNQFLRGEIKMPFAENKAQAIGSAITYAKRYSYSAMLNLVADIDDDGEAAMPSRNNEVREELNEKMKKQERISQLQVAQVWAAMKRNGKTAEELRVKLAAKNLIQLEDVTQELFPLVINWANGGGSVKAIKEPEGHPFEMKRIFATASDRGVPEADVKRYAYETHKVDSMTKLGKPQLQEVLEWVQGA